MTARRVRVLASVATDVAAVAVASVALAGCAGEAADAGADDETPGGTLTVFAAASLRDTFTEIGQEVGLAHPGLDVRLSFAGSSDLVTQLAEGASADVVATADLATMDRLVAAGLVEEPTAFASNTLTVVVPPGNPGGVTSFADLARPDLDVVVCAPQVPCGSATERLEAATGVTLRPASEESSVTDVLTKVVTEQADAGVVYVTDAVGAGSDVEVVEVPEAADVVNVYPIAVLDDAAEPELAAELVDLVTGARGRQLFADAGFAPPPA